MPKTPANRPPDSLRFPNDAAVTIGGLARAAEVGVETVRYYQRRHVLAVPHSARAGSGRSERWERSWCRHGRHYALLTGHDGLKR
jgi:hypothetical protein